MSYQDTMNALIQNGYISIVVIMDPNGGVYWTNQPEWQVNGPALIKAWQTREPGVNIAGTRFSIIISEWDAGRLVGRNVGGAGAVVMVRAPNNYIFLTWTPGDVQIPPLNIYTEVERMAALFR
ncbi:MAG: profilin family protein [Candidatus Hodarchaeota archaeon]